MSNVAEMRLSGFTLGCQHGSGEVERSLFPRRTKVPASPVAGQNEIIDSTKCHRTQAVQDRRPLQQLQHITCFLFQIIHQT